MTAKKPSVQNLGKIVQASTNLKWNDVFPYWQPSPWQDDPSRLDEAYRNAIKGYAICKLSMESGLPDAFCPARYRRPYPLNDGFPD